MAGIGQIKNRQAPELKVTAFTLPVPKVVQTTTDHEFVDSLPFVPFKLRLFFRLKKYYPFAAGKPTLELIKIKAIRSPSSRPHGDRTT
jgi:hypothetical protein